ncbi:MAG: serine/threonine protein kinase [Candidatus Hydrogenedentes bacterium]|nr:serine/threonine protein kinase [Candidatus Hydrogenedentota bacterium]
MIAASQPRPGDTLGKYQILSEIGRGGMGVVYLALDQSLDRQVALKVLPPSLTMDTEFIRRFRQEAKTIATIAHPNVVHVHAFEIVDGIPLIEMEYIEGGSLARKLYTGAVSPAAVVRYAYGVAGALAWCHGMNAVHRDVKTSNILIDNRNQARLADFGIAKAMADTELDQFTQSRSGNFRGTPHYVPPEAWDGQAPTPAWDIYSLGVVMFEAATGTLPYPANTPLELIKRIASSPPPSVRGTHLGISDSLGALIEDMLKTDPERRVGDAAAVCKRLEDTPEYAAPGNTRNDTQVIPRPSRRVKLPAQGPRSIRLATALWSGLLLLVLAVACAFYFAPAGRTTASGTMAAMERAPLLEYSRLPANYSDDMVLSHSGNVAGGEYRIFRTHPPSVSGWPEESWLVSFAADGAPIAVVAFSLARLAAFSLAPSGNTDEYVVEGQWAGYMDAQGATFRRGAVRGHLQLPVSTHHLVGVLEYTAEQLGTSVEIPVTASLHDTIATDTRFVHELEASPYLQPLLFSELIPRRQSWVNEIASLFPFHNEEAGRAVLEPLPEGSFSVDGALDDSLWAARFSTAESAPGALEGLPHAARPRMHFACDGQQLALGMQCRPPASTGKLFFKLHFMPAFMAPLQGSPVLRVAIDMSSGEATEWPGSRDAAPRPAQGAFAVSRSGDWWNVEGALPLSGFGEAVAAPTHGSLWRLNATVYEEFESGEKEVLCRWGGPDAADLAHGAVLRFEEKGMKE